MTALSIQPPFPIFTDTDGSPLENGYIWLGTANQDPQANPITAYWDAALTITAAQPIRTSGGYPARSGTPARLYVASDYSIRVQNKNGSTLYSAPEATEAYGGGIINASVVVYDPAGLGAVPTTVQAKLRETVSVKDFGADPAASAAANTTAIAAALTYAGTKKCGVYVPGEATAYQVNDEFTVPDGVTVFGDGWGSFIQQITLNKDVFIAGDCNTFQNLRLKIADGDNAEFVNCIYAVNVNNLTVESCFLESSNLGGCGIHIRGVQNSQIRGNRIYNGQWSPTGAGAGASAADILLYSSGTSERHIIEGNHCLSNNSQGIFISALGYDGDIIVANNICVTLDPATCTETGTWSLVANGGVRRHAILASYNNSQPGRPRVIIDGNICRNTTWTGIYKQGTSDNEVIISNNLCDLNGYDTSNALSGGIYVESPGRSSVIGNTITNFQNTTLSTGGITLNQASAENIPGLVSGNKITDSLASGIALGTFSRLVTISNNVIFGSAQNDIYMVNAGGSAVVGGHTFTGNTIYRTSGNNIPSIYYDQQASTRYATIKDNTIQGFDNTNNDVSNTGIRVRTSTDLVQVFGNVISNFYYGFTCQSYYSGRLLSHVIARNNIIDCAVGFGVSATATTHTLPLVDNVFVNTPIQVSSPIGAAVGRIVQRLGDNLIWQTTAAPTVGSWAVGDRSINSTPAVGQPKAWACTVTGTPGTWVSEGNL
jgi:hypothetical protein